MSDLKNDWDGNIFVATEKLLFKKKLLLYPLLDSELFISQKTPLTNIANWANISGSNTVVPR